MTQIDIAALVADREAGTQGPLVVSDFCMEGSHMTAVAFPDRFGVPGDTVAEFFSNWRDASHKEYRISWAQAEANARRFARVPEMEAALIAQDAELKRLRLSVGAQEDRIDALMIILTEALPWVEAQIDDPAYKPGTVRAVANRIRAALGEKP